MEKSKREKIISALINAKHITPEDADNYIPLGREEKVTELAANGLGHIKGLWLLTSLRYDEHADLILDTDLTGFELTKLIAAIGKYIPHDICFLMKRDVLGEEPSMISGFGEELQSEILEGRIRTVFIRDDYE